MVNWDKTNQRPSDDITEEQSAPEKLPASARFASFFNIATPSPTYPEILSSEQEEESKEIYREYLNPTIDALLSYASQNTNERSSDKGEDPGMTFTTTYAIADTKLRGKDILFLEVSPVNAIMQYQTMAASKEGTLLFTKITQSWSDVLDTFDSNKENIEDIIYTLPENVLSEKGLYTKLNNGATKILQEIYDGKALQGIRTLEGKAGIGEYVLDQHQDERFGAYSSVWLDIAGFNSTLKNLTTLATDQAWEHLEQQGRFSQKNHLDSEQRPIQALEKQNGYVRLGLDVDVVGKYVSLLSYSQNHLPEQEASSLPEEQTDTDLK